jgi:hypothetical protein
MQHKNVVEKNSFASEINPNPAPLPCAYFNQRRVDYDAKNASNPPYIFVFINATNEFWKKGGLKEH